MDMFHLKKGCKLDFHCIHSSIRKNDCNALFALTAYLYATYRGTGKGISIRLRWQAKFRRKYVSMVHMYHIICTCVTKCRLTDHTYDMMKYVWVCSMWASSHRYRTYCHGELPAVVALGMIADVSRWRGPRARARQVSSKRIFCTTNFVVGRRPDTGHGRMVANRGLFPHKQSTVHPKGGSTYLR
jgi:hypothetical protein